MMNKILVKLYVPMLEQEYDIKIPANKKIYDIIKLLVKIIVEFSDGYYKPKSFPTLYDKSTAKPYNIRLTVKQSNIKNATELILV